VIRGPLHNSTIPEELKEGDTYVSLKDQGIYLQDVRNIPTQFVDIGPSTGESVGSPMPDVLHENASVHSPHTRDTVVLKEGNTCILLRDESGKRSMPGLVARETESLPKGGPNSIYYEKARQNDLDDVDGWPALSVYLFVIGAFLCYRSRSLYDNISFCLFLFSSSDPVKFWQKRFLSAGDPRHVRAVYRLTFTT